MSVETSETQCSVAKLDSAFRVIIKFIKLLPLSRYSRSSEMQLSLAIKYFDRTHLCSIAMYIQRQQLLHLAD